MATLFEYKECCGYMLVANLEVIYHHTMSLNISGVIIVWHYRYGLLQQIWMALY